MIEDSVMVVRKSLTVYWKMWRRDIKNKKSVARAMSPENHLNFEYRFIQCIILNSICTSRKPLLLNSCHPEAFRLLRSPQISSANSSKQPIQNPFSYSEIAQNLYLSKLLSSLWRKSTQPARPAQLAVEIKLKATRSLTKAPSGGFERREVEPKLVWWIRDKTGNFAAVQVFIFNPCKWWRQWRWWWRWWP